jgi:hypothetical protein
MYNLRELSISAVATMCQTEDLLQDSNESRNRNKERHTFEISSKLRIIQNVLMSNS